MVQRRFQHLPGNLIVNQGTEERLTSEWGAVNFTRNGLRTNYNGVTLLLARLESFYLAVFLHLLPFVRRSSTFGNLWEWGPGYAPQCVYPR